MTMSEKLRHLEELRRESELGAADARREAAE